MTQSPDVSGAGASPHFSRLGPSLALLGLASWVVTLAAYLLLTPAESMPGEPMQQSTAIRLVVAFVVAALGVFASAIVSAVGLLLSLTERRDHPSPRATRGVVLGVIGVASLILVVIEIVRLAFTTT